MNYMICAFKPLGQVDAAQPLTYSRSVFSRAQLLVALPACMCGLGHKKERARRRSRYRYLAELYPRKLWPVSGTSST